jgi:sulfur-oxidizing protein SoxZ
MGDPMRIRAVAKGGSVNVKILMSHPMETGQRKGGDGKPIPAHFIQRVSATWQGKTVLSAQWGTAISKNPFLEFDFKGGNKGDVIKVTWTDNKGETRTDEATIK